MTDESTTGGNAANFYAPPVPPLKDATPMIGGSMDPVPPSVIMLMRQTSTWVSLLAILLTVVGAGWLLFTSIADIFAAESSGPRRQPGILLFALIPALVYLSRYARDIRRLLRDPAQGALEDALRSQKSLWKYLAILTVLELAFIFLLSLRSVFR